MYAPPYMHMSDSRFADQSASSLAQSKRVPYTPDTVFCSNLSNSYLMWVLQGHLQAKERKKRKWQVCFWPFPLFTLWFCSRLCGENSLVRFCLFPNEIGLNLLLPTLNQLRLETNYELIQSLEQHHTMRNLGEINRSIAKTEVRIARSQPGRELSWKNTFRDITHNINDDCTCFF